MYESESAYRARLEAGDWKKMLPGYTATNAAGASSAGSVIAAPNVYVHDGTTIQKYDVLGNPSTIVARNILRRSSVWIASLRDERTSA